MADGVVTPEEEEARTRFAKEKRWNLLTALAWIATRDMRSAWRASRRGETIHGAGIAITVAGAMDGTVPIHETLEDAWRLDLAPAVSDGKISGSGSIVSIAETHERREVGFTFPSPSKPREADHLEPSQRGSELALTPSGQPPGQPLWGVTEWRDLVFAADDVLRLWPAKASQLATPAPSKFPPPDYRYLSDALADFVKFKNQHGEVSADDAETEMFDAIKSGRLGVHIEDARGVMRRLPASDIEDASQRSLFIRIFSDRPLFQISGNPLEAANGYRALVHEGDFRDWTYWVRMSPEAQARATADEAEIERLQQLERAEWSPPANFVLADLDAACGGQRPWLSLVINFMTFGTPWHIPEGMGAAEVMARQAPVARLIFESARRGENRLVGILDGERLDRPLPEEMFDHPQSYRPDNIVRASIEHLEGDLYVAARKNPVPDWTSVRLSWPHLKLWLIKHGVQTRPPEPGEDHGRREAIELDLAQGHINPDEADRQLKEGTGRGAASAPPVEDFAPEEEPLWNVAMAVLWIAHRSHARVVEGMPDWTLRATFVRDEETGMLYGPGELENLPLAKGYRTQPLWSPRLSRLLLWRPDRELYRASFDELKKRITASKLKTIGISEGKSVEIPSFKWWHLDPVDEPTEEEYFGAMHTASTERFYEVFVAREDIEREWPGESAQFQGDSSNQARKRRASAGEPERDYLTFKGDRQLSREDVRAWREGLPYYISQDRAERLRKTNQGGQLKSGPKPKTTA